MEPSGSQERRRLPRILLPGGVRPDEDPHAPPIEILDISVGGIRYETDRRMPPGTRLWFWFDYFQVEFRATCEVAWAHLTDEGAWEHGARFVDLSPAEEKVVAVYVKDLEDLKAGLDSGTVPRQP